MPSIGNNDTDNYTRFVKKNKSLERLHHLNGALLTNIYPRAAQDGPFYLYTKCFGLALIGTLFFLGILYAGNPRL